MNGGDIIAAVLQAQGVRFLYTLTGGHIAPILVGAKRAGVRVVDTRHEATAVLAADATARLTGVPGVAVVTAGPGVTNTVTAVKNAQVAQSPVLLIGGAVPTLLRGRGALQDIDQIALLKSTVKWTHRVKRVKEIVPVMEEAFRRAQEGAPGPVFVETPVDLLYDENIVRRLYGQAGKGKSLAQRLERAYLNWHVNRLFAGSQEQRAGSRVQVEPPRPDEGKIRQVAKRLQEAERPVLVLGSQVVLDIPRLEETITAIERIAAPVYLSGMARGLLGRDHPLHMRHKRSKALREADFALLAGVPCDFRLNYGRHIPRRAFYASVNRSRHDLNLNRRPDVGALADPAAFLRELAARLPSETRWSPWLAHLRERDQARNEEIERMAREPVGGVNPLHLLRELDARLGPNALLVADGGDFVGSAAYIVQPPGPMRWLDPGPFGALGVGAGFALAAKLNRPEAEVWIIYGDGSAGYSLAEFDTFVRHQVPVIALVGNDAAWMQIAREQVEMLGDDVGTVLRHADYHRVVEGFDAAGVRLDDPELSGEVIEQAQTWAAEGRPVLINAILGKTDFRKGSISM
ncbi:MAG: thiamine pyrophosphate-binding protein [Chloroflexi bacterium]|nr:thiamine pyrophosphate-binding protein [Chloroflexota bacterium]